jgi:hypothetical protein
MFRLFTDAENVRELLVHRCRSQHFEPRKRRVYEVLFAELLKLGAPSTSETDSDETLTQERQRAGWAPRGRGSSIRLVRCGQVRRDLECPCVAALVNFKSESFWLLLKRQRVENVSRG